MGLKGEKMDKELRQLLRELTRESPEWTVECEVQGQWVELTRKQSEEEANKVAEFMRLARCGDVRVTSHEKKS